MRIGEIVYPWPDVFLFLPVQEADWVIQVIVNTPRGNKHCTHKKPQRSAPAFALPAIARYGMHGTPPQTQKVSKNVDHISTLQPRISKLGNRNIKGDVPFIVCTYYVLHYPMYSILHFNAPNSSVMQSVSLPDEERIEKILQHTVEPGLRPRDSLTLTSFSVPLMAWICDKLYKPEIQLILSSLETRQRTLLMLRPLIFASSEMIEKWKGNPIGINMIARIEIISPILSPRKSCEP